MIGKKCLLYHIFYSFNICPAMHSPENVWQSWNIQFWNFENKTHAIQERINSFLSLKVLVASFNTVSVFGNIAVFCPVLKISTYNDGRVPYRDSFGNRDLSHLSMMSGGLGIRLSLNWSKYFISVSSWKRVWIEELNFVFFLLFEW